MTSQPGYRAAILALVPHLRSLDGQAVALDAIINEALDSAVDPKTLSDKQLGIQPASPDWVNDVLADAEAKLKSTHRVATAAQQRPIAADRALDGRCDVLLHKVGVD